MLCVTFLVSNSAGSIKQYHTQTQTLAQKKKKGYISFYAFLFTFLLFFFPFLFFFSHVHLYSIIMGILLSKLGSTSTVDHGKTKTQGLYTTNLDYDSTIASQLVLKGRLAPFYKGRKR
jgi:hypothetical protein